MMTGFAQNKPKSQPINITTEKKDIVVAYLVDRTAEMNTERFGVSTKAKIQESISSIEMSLILNGFDAEGYIYGKGNLEIREVVVKESLFSLNKLGGFKYLEECLFGNFEKLGYELVLLKNQVEEQEKKRNKSGMLDKVMQITTIISNTTSVFKQLTGINPA